MDEKLEEVKIEELSVKEAEKIELDKDAEEELSNGKGEENE